MRPEYEKIIDKPDHSFTAKVVRRNNRSKLSQAWHYHPEIEICYTVTSNGRRFVGNQISDYHEFDLVMFGSNLPHGFVTKEYSKQIVIQMNNDFLGEAFIKRPELRKIQKLFSLASRGIEFGAQTKLAVKQLLDKILQTESMGQLINLLSILDLLSQSSDYNTICSEEYSLNVNVAQFSRLKLVYDHIMLNFRQEVSIKEVADKLNLSEAGFYKFIKKQTKKSYTQIINEFRINHACNHLIESEKTISEISYECGYNNQSYFNRKFKEVMQITPYEFKRRYTNDKEKRNALKEIMEK